MSRAAHADFLDTRPDLPAMLFALAALGAVSLPLLAQLPLGVAAVFVGFILLRVWLLFLGIRALPSWQLMLLLVGVMGLVWQQLGTLFGLQGGIAFLLMLSLLKSFEGKSRRDWQVLVLVMLFLTAGAVLFDQDLLTGLWVLGCLMLMAMSLAVLNEAGLRAAWRHSLTAFALTLPLMMLLFVTAPRRDTPLWGVPQNTAAKGTTGMSETMRPGSIGELVQSNEPAFSATFDGGFVPQPHQLYWRVMVLAEFKQGAWQMMQGYADTALPAPSEQAVPYQMIVEDEKGRIPALDYPTVQPQRGMLREAGNMLRVRSRSGVRRIRLQATLRDELPHALTQGEAAYYTRLPDNTNLRTRALARELWRQNGGNVERYAAAVLNHFRQQGFVYTLRPPLARGNDATDDFMFGGKQGFCEHYADAFTVMMRAAGVPARVVAGYLGGEYNSDGGFWQIRSKDAHAWTEIWLPEKQAWKRIDPTAAVSAVRIDGGLEQALPPEQLSVLAGSGFPAWTRLLDRSRFYWQQWIINYDSSRQQSLLSRLGLGELGRWGLPLLAVLLLLPSLLPVWWWWWRSRRNDVRSMEDGMLLLKETLLGRERADLAAVGAQALKDELQDELTPQEAQLLDDYIRLNYARSGTPSAAEARAWYARVRRVVKQRQKRAD